MNFQTTNMLAANAGDNYNALVDNLKELHKLNPALAIRLISAIALDMHKLQTQMTIPHDVTTVTIELIEISTL